MKHIYILILFFSLFSKAQNYKAFKITSAKYVFNLSENQGVGSRLIEYDAINNELSRSVEYPGMGIEVFDFRTGLLKKNIPLNIDALDVFTKAGSNEYYTHDPWKRIFRIINNKGEILKNIDESAIDQSQLVYVSTGGSAFCPVIIYKGTLYISGLIGLRKAVTYDTAAYKRSGIIEKILPNGQISYIGRPATVTVKSFYGFLNNYSITLNKNLLIISSYVSDVLQIVNLDNNTEKYIMITNGESDKLIKPMGLITDRNDFTNQAKNTFFLNSYKNIGIVYDKYRDVYYRFVTAPSSGYGTLDCTIFVLNSNFKILFKEKIPRSCSPGQFFVTAEGLAILNQSAYNSDQKKLSFDLFKPIN